MCITILVQFLKNFHGVDMVVNMAQQFADMAANLHVLFYLVLGDFALNWYKICWKTS